MYVKNKYSLENLLKKMKAHEKKELLPLYQKQAKYLFRTIAGSNLVNNLNFFTNQIETFISVATCHEVALNENSNLNIETHNNKNGVEAIYTQHPKSKNISRNIRVRIIWRFLEKLIKENPNFIGIEPIINNNFVCPICNTSIENNSFENNCEHAIVNFNDFEDQWYYENFEYKIREIADDECINSSYDVFELYEIETGKSIISNEFQDSLYIFIKDINSFITWMEKKYEKIEQK